VNPFSFVFCSWPSVVSVGFVYLMVSFATSQIAVVILARLAGQFRAMVLTSGTVFCN